MQTRVPDDPLERVWITRFISQRFAVTPEPVVKVGESPIKVPATPPHLTRKIKVGVPVVEC
jgi:hypothetical protein